MFFRKQSFCLALVFLISAWAAKEALFPNGEIALAAAALGVAALCLLSAGGSLVSLLSYKKRLRQFIINRLVIGLQLIILAIILYRTFKNGVAYDVFAKGAPLVNIILLLAANRYIKKDEDLVRSVDRIR